MLRLFWVLSRALRALWPQLRDLPLRVAIALGGTGKGRPAQPSRLWKAIAISSPIALLAAIFVPKITLVMSPSIDAWAVMRAPGPIQRGDYVMFELLHPVAGPKPVSVTKHALCLPGEMLLTVESRSRPGAATIGTRYLCNGEWLGTALPYSHNGLKLDHFVWNGPVPPGLVYVGSRYPRSFDSRYYGLVPIGKLTRMIRIL